MRNIIDAELFIKTFCDCAKTGKSIKVIAQRLNTTPGAVYSRVTYFRKKGIKLPTLVKKQRGNKLNVSVLNKLVREIMK